MEQPDQRSREELWSWLIFGGLLLALAIRLFVLYWPFSFYQYLVPPGGDAVNHLHYIDSILQGNWNVSYPLFFHALIALIVKITHQPPVEILKWVSPILVVLPPLALYYFSRRLFDLETGIIAFLVGLWVASYALVAFGDGNYPNLLAGGFFAPLALAMIVLAILRKSKKYLIWSIVMAIFVVLTHHLTTGLFLAVLATYFIVLLIWNYFELITPGIRKITIIFFAVVAMMILVIYLTPIRPFFENIIKSVISSGYTVYDPTFIEPLKFHNYPEVIGGFVWYGGLLSLAYLIYLLSKPKDMVNKPALLMVLVWFVVLFLLSRIKAVGFPARIGRELSLPLILAIAISISDLIRSQKAALSRILTWGIIGFAIAISLVQVNANVYMSPEFFNRMVWFTQNDLEKAEFIKALVEPGETILANPTTPFLPIFCSCKVYSPDPADISDEARLLFEAKQAKARYIYIGNKTDADPDETIYPDFAAYEKKTAALKKAAADLTVIKKFDDGATIYEVNSTLN